MKSGRKRSTSDNKKIRKILCIADAVDPLVYSQNMKERYRDVDLVVAAGDLKMRYLGFIASMLNKKIYFVFGNHDLQYLGRFRKNERDYMDRDGFDLSKNFFGSTYIGDKVILDRKTGLIFAGLGGSMKYNNGENQYSNRQMFWKIIRLFPKLAYHKLVHGRWVDILVTHAPPLGIHDGEDLCHRGFDSFLWFMRKFKPRYLLHGHVHLQDINDIRETDYFETRVINVYSRYLLEVDTDR